MEVHTSALLLVKAAFTWDNLDG